MTAAVLLFLDSFNLLNRSSILSKHHFKPPTLSTRALNLTVHYRPSHQTRSPRGWTGTLAAIKPAAQSHSSLHPPLPQQDLLATLCSATMTTAPAPPLHPPHPAHFQPSPPAALAGVLNPAISPTAAPQGEQQRDSAYFSSASTNGELSKRMCQSSLSWLSVMWKCSCGGLVGGRQHHRHCGYPVVPEQQVLTESSTRQTSL